MFVATHFCICVYVCVYVCMYVCSLWISDLRMHEHSLFLSTCIRLGQDAGGMRVKLVVTWRGGLGAEEEGVTFSERVGRETQGVGICLHLKGRNALSLWQPEVESRGGIWALFSSFSFCPRPCRLFPFSLLPLTLKEILTKRFHPVSNSAAGRVKV